LGLCRDGYYAEQQCNGEYFQCFFQDAEVLYWT
jgi:hypothetical protein